MITHRIGLYGHVLFAGLAAAFFVAFASTASAYWVPCLIPTVWLNGNTVNYKVFDPIRNYWSTSSGTWSGSCEWDAHDGVVSWNSGNNGRVNYAVYDLARGSWRAGYGTWSGYCLRQNHDGVVAWASMNDGRVNYATYDPAKGSWQTGYQTWRDSCALTNQGGVVAWVSGTPRQVNYATYDPAKGSWQTGNQTWNDTCVQKNQDGVVAWVSINLSSLGNDVRVYYTTYDPARSSWRTSSSILSYWTTDFTIAEATVSWTLAGVNHKAGYRPSTGGWYSGNTCPGSSFVVTPSSGDSPLFVWFLDNSVGATSWKWTFGDGGTSTLRSPWHTYSAFGVFTATLSVSSAGGSHSTTMQIKTDVTAPSGSLVINGDAPFENTPSVNLGLSATDNSGSVAAMRFSNDGATWSSWDPYAATMSWTLDTAEGTKTVFAQFRDAASNESSVCSDSIVLDSTPPVGGILSAMGGYRTVKLNWSGFADALSGLSHFTLTYGTDSVPGPWPDGTLAYSGTDLTYQHTNLENSVTYTYRLTAFDNAGNSSTGLVVSGTPSEDADTDADGMPDWWEEKYFVDATNGAPGDDVDNDGMKNWEEFFAGTNPTNSQSVFAFTLPEGSTAPNVLTWYSAADRYYEVHKSTKLSAGFSVLESWILGTPPMNTYTDITAPSVASFYKLAVTAPDVRLVAREILFHGNGHSSFFQGTIVHSNVVPKSMQISSLTDNGHGVLSGSNGSGTINYTNGAWTVTYLQAPSNFSLIYATYRYLVDP